MNGAVMLLLFLFKVILIDMKEKICLNCEEYCSVSVKVVIFSIYVFDCLHIAAILTKH